ncbi:zinc-dependent peptidase [Larsenimonas rhizosphaerae]|uniref:M90 family metallopeptidase n=1 Tax=Larsenimonas rhizosphaerae TaxID=2944682 RepID=UPI00203411BC|nr:M90 family metallopeptidase [Larsenimonas rhizosphaerae]MCM2129954.1 zinc-dependent peptidase [Larsenimonas rhizosphaerae]
MQWLAAWQRKRFLKRHPLPEAAWRDVLSRLPVTSCLDAAARQRLMVRGWQRLHHLAFHFPEPLTWTLEDQLSVAAHIELITLYWPDSQARWPDVHDIVVVPDAFRRHLVETDTAGVIHEHDDERIGETSSRGPVVLSMNDMQADRHHAGVNVIIHEFIHKLDMQNDGVANGFPPLHGDISSRRWHATFTRVWQDLTDHVARGAPTPINEYAATDPAECLAVCCEYFFTAPGRLKATYPELHALLVEYFRQDPGLKRTTQHPGADGYNARPSQPASR